MIKAGSMTKDAAKKIVVGPVMDFSAAAANHVIFYDQNTDYKIQRADLVIGEVCATSSKIINIGTAADPDAIVDASSIATTAAAASVVELLTTATDLVAGTPLSVGHEQTGGTGTGFVCVEMIPKDTNPSTRGVR